MTYNVVRGLCYNLDNKEKTEHFLGWRELYHTTRVLFSCSTEYWNDEDGVKCFNTIVQTWEVKGYDEPSAKKS